MDAGRLLRSRALVEGLARVCISDGERVQMVWRSSIPRSPDRSAVFIRSRRGAATCRGPGAVQRWYAMSVAAHDPRTWEPWPGLIPITEVLVNILRV